MFKNDFNKLLNDLKFANEPKLGLDPENAQPTSIILDHLRRNQGTKSPSISVRSIDNTTTAEATTLSSNKKVTVQTKLTKEDNLTAREELIAESNNNPVILATTEAIKPHSSSLIVENNINVKNEEILMTTDQITENISNATVKNPTDVYISKESEEEVTAIIKNESNQHQLKASIHERIVKLSTNATNVIVDSNNKNKYEIEQSLLKVTEVESLSTNENAKINTSKRKPAMRFHEAEDAGDLKFVNSWDKKIENLLSLAAKAPTTKSRSQEMLEEIRELKSVISTSDAMLLKVLQSGPKAENKGDSDSFLWKLVKPFIAAFVILVLAIIIRLLFLR